MPLLDLINQFVVEHGSATVQEKHIALLREQASILEKRLADAERERDNLKSENATLKQELSDLSRQNAQADSMHSLSEATERVLACLVEREDESDGQIARRLGLRPQVATFHLETLLDRKLVEVVYTAGFGSAGPSARWFLSKDGRKYLFDHDLL